ncbi:MAG: beta-glucosidase, partial [Chitinophagaceae bacterium]|nr:beta-glucosidase [Chitinophagaceae bacterium]
QNVLYWHYSPDRGWVMNMQIKGWNECLITYVLAAASTTHGIPPAVYTNGWASGGGFLNGASYYGYTLPLGPAQGGPLFFSHYSFMGINPNGLSDAFTNYATQTRNHSLINYKYCVANPRGWFGYSDSCWGLTASDIAGGYTASSPTNDVSVIAPTAAISSMPYTPLESMQALKFFYYVLGDKIWKEYGFVDAFSLKDLWFANSVLAIDQGPMIVMIENHRTGLLWSLFTSCPEVKAGMLSLGFSAPYL